MRSILQFLGFGWSKWKTIEERKPMLKDIYNPVTGYMSRSINVTVDVQRRENNLTGKVQYKHIER